MRENEIEGTVRINFVLSAQGKIEDNSLQVVKAVCYQTDKKGEKQYLPNCKLFEEEAKRVVRLLPEGKPAYQNGKAIRMRFQIPFRFQLD